MKPFQQGFAAGLDAFRLTGDHQVPTNHPRGETPEGRDWFLGCCSALKQCSDNLQPKPRHNESLPR